MHPWSAFYTNGNQPIEETLNISGQHSVPMTSQLKTYPCSISVLVVSDSLKRRQQSAFGTNGDQISSQNSVLVVIKSMKKRQHSAFGTDVIQHSAFGTCGDQINEETPAVSIRY